VSETQIRHRAIEVRNVDTRHAAIAIKFIVRSRWLSIKAWLNIVSMPASLVMIKRLTLQFAELFKEREEVRPDGKSFR